MATASDLITRALRRCRALGRDEVPTAEDSADGLIALNNLLDLWWNERLTVFHITQENFTLTPGQASYTIGTGGNFNTTRPVKITDGCFVRYNSQDFPVATLQDRVPYDNIIQKTLSGMPQVLFYDAAMPTGTVYFWPVPDQAYQVYLNSLGRLQSLAGLTTQVSLPPGYDTLLVDGLAIDRAPEYGIEAPGAVLRSFARAMRVLKRVNAPSLTAGFDSALLPKFGVFDISTGGMR